jgi:hypothetical protein
MHASGNEKAEIVPAISQMGEAMPTANFMKGKP